MSTTPFSMRDLATEMSDEHEHNVAERAVAAALGHEGKLELLIGQMVNLFRDGEAVESLEAGEAGVVMLRDAVHVASDNQVQPSVLDLLSHILCPDEIRARVVPGTPVLGTRVAQADNQLDG